MLPLLYLVLELLRTKQTYVANASDNPPSWRLHHSQLSVPAPHHLVSSPPFHSSSLLRTSPSSRYSSVIHSCLHPLFIHSIHPFHSTAQELDTITVTLAGYKLAVYYSIRSDTAPLHSSCAYPCSPLYLHP
mmetsp:Transcript_15145/g.18255  ORF Transcript_15145/g.18255 Transcript_15145/m.18255 type:complete len:131 (+) Transcript_15145:134-526(+)